ncbi:MAG: hypothetical protein CVU59_07170 [Deltaproteobacteria bacterium HGW-Deltaproteobacteria-17]|nr:MAG: hypothetical protein CVU59_07170 [Deltaproteobacteria bacterium HGW-Deltaproteobacteria-17]
MSTIHPTQLDGNPIQDLPLTALLQPASDIVKASGLESIHQIGFYQKNNFQFFFEFETGHPSGEIRPLFPAMDSEELLAEGWDHVALELHLAVQKVTLVIRGYYFREPVPLDFHMTIVQGPAGYLKDTIVITDRRTQEPENTSFKDIMEIRLKSGDPKYAGTNDVYGSMTITRMVKILNRFLRDWTVSHRIIERH